MNDVMQKREVWLFDPAGGGIIETKGVIMPLPLKIRVIGTVETNKERFNPGELLITQAALDRVGDWKVLKLFVNHLQGIWEGMPEEDKRDNDTALRTGHPLYNWPTPETMIVTYQGQHTTLILREEY